MATKDEVKSRVFEMMHNPDFNEYLLRDINSFLDSGFLDISEAENDFRLPRIVLSAALLKAASHVIMGRDAWKKAKDLSGVF